MNLASALLKQVIFLQDSETWSLLRLDYLPPEYHTIFSVVDKHYEKFHQLPTLEELKLSVRDTPTLEKLYAIEAVEVDVDPQMLLQYVKNEYAQKEILLKLEDYVENSIAFEDAEESITHLHQIVLDVEDKVEIELPSESMQRIHLFESEEDLGKYLPLGLNTDFDHRIQFSPRDLILIGGRRGAGKSVTCANVANNVYNNGKTAIYFTIEMDSRSILQRLCAIETGVSAMRLRTKNLSLIEWEQVAAWWANRFVNGAEKFEEYKDHRSFDELHRKLTTKDELLPTQQLDVIYEPTLTLAKIQAELDKKIKTKNVGVIIVDYLNQIRRSMVPHRSGQYDWTEQIEIAKALKAMAQEYETPVVSPYQIDVTGEARFAKGILDSADAAYTLEAWEEEDACMTFTCRKMRSGPRVDFTSYVDWNSLKIGPESARSPLEKAASDASTGEPIEDL